MQAAEERDSRTRVTAHIAILIFIFVTVAILWKAYLGEREVAIVVEGRLGAREST